MGLAAVKDFEKPRVLRYRAHVRWIFKGCYALGALFAVFTLAILALKGQFRNPNGGLISGAFMAFISAECFFLGRFLVRPLSQFKVQIYDDSMTLFRVGKEIVIPFSSIAKVRFSSIPYIGGWFMIKLENRKSYRFTVVLERSDYLLDAIHQARPGLCQEKKFFRYRRTAIFADHSWARLYDACRRWPLLVVKYGLFPITGFFVVRERGLPLLAPTAALLMPMFGYALYLLGEMIFAARVRKALKIDASNVRRDVTKENSLLRKLNWFYYGSLTLALALLFLK